MKNKAIAFIIFWIILFAALALRMNGLTWGLPTKTLALTTYHPDEPYLFQVFENIYRTHSLHPGRIGLLYGTFYFYIAGFLILIAKVLHLVTIGSRDTLLQNLSNLDKMYLAVRLFSVACGTASVIGVYFLGKRLFDATTGLWSVFFLAFAPISIAVSHYAKVDALLPLLVTALLWLTFDLMEKPGLFKASLCGLAAGLLASTKYNAGIFVLTPIVALLFIESSAIEKIRFGSAIVFGSIFGFVLTTPYAVLDFPLFISCLKEQFGMMGSGGVWNMGEGNGFRVYAAYYIPFGIGWIGWILALAGLIFVLMKRDRQKIVFIISFVVMLALLSRAAVRVTSYTAPLLPFVTILAAFAVNEIRIRLSIRPVKILFLAGVGLFQIAYGASFSRLYSEPNPREECGDWLLQNVSTEKSVGIIRSYFWTPGILRQAKPPYPLVKAGDDLSPFHLAVFNLKNIHPLPEYFVVSEMETREFFRIEKIDPSYARAIRDFLSHYTLIQNFELKPKILVLSFWRRPQPWDFLMIAPSMQIYKLKT